MHVLFICVMLANIILNTNFATADIVRARMVVRNSQEVGVKLSWLPFLASVKICASMFLVLGVLGITTMAVIGSIILVVFFVGAIVTHVRARVFHNIAAPVGFLALALSGVALAAVS